MTDSSPHGIRTSGTQAEEGHLDQVLRDSDSLLAKSLRVEERRRRRRRLILFFLLTGGIVMTTTFVAVLAGWLTLAAPPPPEQAETTPSAQQAETKAAWIEQLKGLRDHMHTAFGVGPDLTLLDPDEGLAIVQEAWPQITVFEVKTGLLKTFAFSKALPEKHLKLFQVLHLGMTDPDPKVNAYAASYLEEYAGEDFTKKHAAEFAEAVAFYFDEHTNEDFSPSSQRYAAWYREYGDKAPAEVAPRPREGRAATGVQRQLEPTGKSVEDDVSALNTQGWRQFFSGNYRSAERTFRKILADNPDHLAAMNGLGFSLLNQGNASEAKTYFEKYLAREPDAPGPLTGLGRCLKAEGNVDEAIKVWERAYELSPGPNDTAAGLARAYAEKGEHTKAIPLLEELVKEHPHNKQLQKALQDARAASAGTDD